MTKRAFLFAGQGAQTLGMARDLYDNYQVVRHLFEEASDLLGYSLRQLIDRDETKLNQTRYTQPAILTTSLAIYTLIKEAGMQPDMVAGLSLGEYSALVAAESLSFKQALALVARRAELMEQATAHQAGKMVAVLNTDRQLIETICKQVSQKHGHVAPANYNTPQQIVIGGEVVAVDQAVSRLKEAGTKRLVPLNVSGPFHTQLMASVSRDLSVVLADVVFSEPIIPVISNTQAKPMVKTEIPSLLTRQVKEPVLFYESIDYLRYHGVTEIVEIGPGKVLSGFVKKIAKELPVMAVTDQNSLETLLEKER